MSLGGPNNSLTGLNLTQSSNRLLRADERLELKPHQSNEDSLNICGNRNTTYNNHGHRMSQMPVIVLVITFYKYRLPYSALFAT